MSFNINFDKIPAHSQQTKPVDPIELFQASAVSDGNINDLWLAQGDALREWHEPRNDKDVAVVLNTGAGKTLVGLPIAQSLVHETQRQVVYACSSIQLDEQTADKAKGYGLPVTTYYGNEFSTDGRYQRAEAPCVTTYQALFNGKTRFASDDIAAVIFDDAHTAEHILRDQSANRPPPFRNGLHLGKITHSGPDQSQVGPPPFSPSGLTRPANSGRRHLGIAVDPKAEATSPRNWVTTESVRTPPRGRLRRNYVLLRLVPRRIRQLTRKPAPRRQEAGCYKPEPAIFRLALDQLGLLPSRDVLFVGDDAVPDIGGAQSVGLSTAWVSRGQSWPSALESPNHQVNHVTELGPLLLG